jgi:hypothetical protein
MRYLTIFSLFFCLLSLPTHAAESRGLYRAEVEVADQGAESRLEGMRQAMAAVLLKVSGNSRVAEDATLAEAMKQPARYVQQYRYRREPLPPQEQETLPPTEEAKQERLLISVRFDQRSIDELLQRSGFNVWGDARPSTLIWLGVEDGGKRVLVGANDKGLVRELIETEAVRRALPVKLPLLDLTDQGKVRTVDVWGEFLDPIREASRRYTSQAILVGRLYPVSSRSWEVHWALDYRGELIRWQSQGDQVAPLITEAVDRVTDHLAMRFAQGSLDGSGEVRMRVEGVQNLHDYRRVVDYLSEVHGVKQVVVELLTPDSVDLRITAEGGIDTVLQIIALGNTLEKVELPPAAMPPLKPVPLMGTADQGEGKPSPDAQTVAAADATTVAEPPQPELRYRLLP